MDTQVVTQELRYRLREESAEQGWCDDERGHVTEDGLWQGLVLDWEGYAWLVEEDDLGRWYADAYLDPKVAQARWDHLAHLWDQAEFEGDES